MNRLNELPIPPAAQLDPKAVELIRVWAAGGQQHITIATGLWSDPAVWGIALVDLAKHLADAYRSTQGMDPSDALNRIKAGFDAEWEEPTATPHGSILSND